MFQLLSGLRCRLHQLLREMLAETFAFGLVLLPQLFYELLIVLASDLVAVAVEQIVADTPQLLLALLK